MGISRVGVIIPAAGKGTRMGASLLKPLLPLAGKPIIAHTVQRFQAVPSVDVIVIAAPEREKEAIRLALGTSVDKKVAAIVTGGNERQDSVWNCLQELGKHSVDIVLIHDAVRPLVDAETIEAVAKAAAEMGGAIAAVRPKDTVKESSDGSFVLRTPDRTHLWIAQTPQGFSYIMLCEAFVAARRDGFQATDDASIFERSGHKVRIIEGSYENIKVTTPDDLALAELIVRARSLKSQGC